VSELALDCGVQLRSRQLPVLRELGLCRLLFEGTNVSKGRSTTRPFELVGAPWIIAERFAAEMNHLS
jgi:uncharacterized protein YbbC (DUF1343 family)